jgi:hypothetical protein
VDGSGLALTVRSPGVLVLEVRAEGGAKGERAVVTLLRDGRWGSEKVLTLKPGKARSPKVLPVQGQVALELPDGAHEVRVSADRRLLVVPRLAKVAPKGALAGAEVDRAPVAVVEAPPEAPPVEAPAPVASAAETALPAAVVAVSAPEPAVAAAPPSAAVGEPGSRTGLAQALRVAVYDFELQGVDPNVGAVVTDSMLGEIRKLQSVSAIGMDEIRTMLSHEATKQYVGCESNESCLAEIAGALGVDNLISGKLSRVDDGAVFLARRIDQKRASVVGVVDKRLKAESGQEYLALVGTAVEELFPEHPLRPGTERGVAKDVALRLDPPPLPPWSFWSAVAGAAAAGIAGGVFGLQARNSAALYDKRVQDSTTQVVEAREITELDATARRQSSSANYSFIGAGVLAVTSVVMALFTDWHGYGDAAATVR